MANTSKKIANDPTMFPPVQTWMTWVDGFTYRYINGQYQLDPTGEGKLRHHYSLAEARKSLMWVARTKKARYDQAGFEGKVKLDFAVYEWVESEWVLRFEGVRGQDRDDCPLFARGLKYDKVHPIDHAKESKAIESILKAAGR